MVARPAGEDREESIVEAILAFRNARSPDELFLRALAGVEALIGYDAAAGVFDRDRKIICADGLTKRSQTLYNEYYRTIQPPFNHRGEAAGNERKWSSIRTFSYRPFHDSEFYIDHARPHHLENILRSQEPGAGLYLSMARSKKRQAFTRQDENTILVLTMCLNHCHSCFCETDSTNTACSAELIRGKFPRLTRRESEVAALLCQRYSAPEIAAQLFISFRTVEMHVSNIYSKLEVGTRRNAIARLLK